MALEGLEAGFALDRRWHWLRGEAERSKEPDLRLLVEILQAPSIPHALRGNIALQTHQRDPRTTLDIDIALLARTDLPRQALVQAGFRNTGQHEHSDNWVGPGGTPVQFTDDPLLGDAVRRAVELPVSGMRLRVLQRSDLLHEKLRAGSDPARRRSKRLQDLADVQALLEQDPGLASELSDEERALLDRLPR